MSNVSLCAGKPRVPKYRRHKSTGQAVVTIGGKDRYLGKYNSAASTEAYKRLTAEYLLQPQRAVAIAHDLSVAELIKAYRAHAKSYYVKDGKPTNEVAMIARAMQITRELYGRTPAAAFGPLALKAVRESMINIGWCRNQINRQIDRVKRLFKWGVSEELVPSGVYEALRAVAGLRKGRSKATESQPVKPVDAETLEATLGHLPPVVRDMVLVQRYCGARPTEVCLMRPGDINRKGDVWEYTPESHKTEHHDRPRVIFLGARAQAILLPYLLRPADAYSFSPAEAEAKRRAERHSERKTPLCCGNRPGTNRQAKPRRIPRERYDVVTYGRAIRRAAESAGVAVWSPHKLRHAFATEVRKSHGLEAVQVCLGHSKANVTEIYTQRDFALAARIAREVG